MPPLDEISILGQDVQDKILCHMSGFSTLRVAIEASKSLYTAYSQHKHTINIAVAKNEGGPTWHDALLAIRIKEGAIHLAYLVDIDLNAEAKHCTTQEVYPESMLVDTGSPTEKEIAQIRTILSSAKKFEEHYSIKKKDATFKGSALLANESMRFKRAFLRFWLLYAIANSPESISVEKSTILNVFRKLPEEELMELTEVWKFVTEMLECIFRLHHDMLYNSVGSVVLVNSPAWIVERFREQAPDAASSLINQSSPVGVRRACERVIYQFESLLLEKDLGRLYDPSRPPERVLLTASNASTSYILDDTSIETLVKCEKCKNIFPQNKLLGPNNWEWLYGNGLSYIEVMELFPGNLSRNHEFRASLWEKIRNAGNFRLVAMIVELFAIDRVVNNEDRPVPLLCFDCLSTFISEHIVGWLIKKLGEGPYKHDPNLLRKCQDGWGCARQTIDIEHNKVFNHLCAPGEA